MPSSTILAVEDSDLDQPCFNVWKHLDMSRTCCCLNTLVLQQTHSRAIQGPAGAHYWSYWMIHRTGGGDEEYPSTYASKFQEILEKQCSKWSPNGINPSKKLIGIVIPSKMENKSWNWNHHELSLPQLGREKLMSVAHLTVKAETRLNSNNSCFAEKRSAEVLNPKISKRSPWSCQHFVSTAS